MSVKREYEDMSDGEISEPDSKRAKKQGAKQRERQHQNSGIDPTWGQKYVFGNEDATTVPHGQESDFEDDSEAMAYLMSVRHQASGIPHLLVAPKVQIGPQLPAGFRDTSLDNDDEIEEGEAEDDDVDRSIYTQGIGDSRGYYEYGAYVAAPSDDDEEEHDEGEDDEDEYAAMRTLHEAYFASLMHQYTTLRAIVNSPPPANVAHRLPSSHPTTTPSSAAATNKLWARTLRRVDPLPLQLALMSKDTVLRVLRVVLGGKFLRRGYPLPERTSRWLWGLLARLPDRGGLNHAEVGWVRDLGRRAVLLGRSLAEMAALRDELAEGQLGVNEGVDGSSTDEDVMAGGDVDQLDAPDSPRDDIETSATSPLPAQKEEQSAARQQKNESKAAPETEEGEVDDADEDTAMDLASDSELEEGETRAETTGSDGNGLQDAKTRLLAQLEHDSSLEDVDPKEAAMERSRMNMRATLNMILCVAGEFYGQRDLLEFRDPFVGM